MNFRYRTATIWGWVPNRENSRRERTKLGADNVISRCIGSVAKGDRTNYR